MNTSTIGTENPRSLAGSRSSDSLEALCLQVVVSPSEGERIHNLGLGLAEKGCLVEALSWINRSTHIIQNSTAAIWTNRAMVLQRLGRSTEAAQDLSMALKLDNIYLPALINYGHLDKDRGYIESAINYYEKAVVLEPNYFPSYDHLSYCYPYPNGLHRRVSAAQRAHFLVPTDPNCGFNFALYCLMTGWLAQGWDLYHFRWFATSVQSNCSYSKRPTLSRPCFDPGNRDAASAVLIWSEQGLGDEIMFLSLLPDFIKSFACALTVQVDVRMLGIWRRSFPGVNFVDRRTLPSESTYQSHLAIGDLPKILRRKMGDFEGNNKSFLLADSQLKYIVSKTLRSTKKPVIGIGWYSANGLSRCVPLRKLIQVLMKFEVTLVNIQYGDVQGDVIEVEKEIGKKLFFDMDVDCTRDLNKLSAVLVGCDFVVSVANATVHLAGALGVRTYALLPFFPGWRWLDNGDRCLWYESVSLIRQSEVGSWESVCEVLQQKLETDLTGYRGADVPPAISHRAL